MDIRDLLEQRKAELYGNYDPVYENMGDITGDVNDEYDVEDTDYNAYLGLDEQDMLDIELEASLINDPDTYMDEASEEFNNEAIALAGELYMDNLIVEEALFECETLRDLEIVEESIKDTIKEKADKAIAKIKELWKKFKAWIVNLKNVIINMFTSGAKLVEKNRSTIKENAERRGKQIKVKCYDYKLQTDRAESAIRRILAVTNVVAEEGKKLDQSAAKKQVYQGARGGEGDMNKESIKKWAAECVRQGDKKERTIGDLNIDNVMDVCANKKEAIKSIKEVEKEVDKGFKAAIDRIKAYKPANEDDKKSVSDNKDVIGSQVKFVKKMNAMASSFVKAYIAEVKAANRACAAICRKLLNQSTGGGDTETKLHKKFRER